MKLIYIANIRLPTEKAHGLAVMKMCEAFAKQGLDLKLVVPRRENSIKEDPFKYYGVERNFKIKRIFCFDFVKFGKLGFIIQWLSFAKFATIYCLFNKADYYYGRDELTLWLISFFKKNIVWEAHIAKDNWLVRNLLKRSKAIVPISKGLRDHYLSLGSSQDKIIVAPSGIDLKTFESIDEDKDKLRIKFNLPLDKKIISYVGRRKTMGESKGVEELEDVFREISKERPDAYLLIVDEAPVADIPYYMKASDVLIMNYPDTPHYAQFMSPLKLFEYMASGVPIITSDLPSIREILDESTAYLFKPNDRKGLVSAVKEFLSNENMAQDKAKKALERVRGFTWKIRARKIIDPLIIRKS